MRHKASLHLPSTIVRNFHYVLLVLVILFMAAALILGEWLKMYDAVWWWDDMLHGVSGVLFGLVGLLAIYFFNARYSMAISPLFVAVFVFCFAITAGVLWEIYEFVIDVIFGTAMQQWNMPPWAKVMGRDFQGMGLRDTMSDLILACIGAVLASVFSYFAYWRERPAVLGVMHRALPWVRKRSN